MPTELQSAIIEIERAIRTLRVSSNETWARKLEQLLVSVRGENPFGRKEALFKIGELCHPKALGDADTRSIDMQTWLAQIDALHDSCARAFNQLEHSPTI